MRKRIGAKRMILGRIAESSLGKRIGKKALNLAHYMLDGDKARYQETMIARLRPESLIPEGEGESLRKSCGVCFSGEEGKIKVRFLHRQANMWNSVKSLYEAFESDDRYSPKIVLIGGYADNMDLIKQMTEMGLDYATMDEYDPLLDSPDICIIYHPIVWPILPKRIRSIRDCASVIVSVPVMTNFNCSVPSYIKELHNDLIVPDACYLDALTYNAVVQEDESYSGYERMGHPSFDVIERKLRGPLALPASWEKLSGKRVLTWATDHGISNSSVNPDLAFDLYAAPILEYFSRHDECALVFRPHTSLIRDLLRSFWGVSDYLALRRYFDESDNLVWDDTDDYATALNRADVIATDANCSMAVVGLATGKPVIILLRDDAEVMEYNRPVTDVLYRVESPSTLETTLDTLLVDNDDPLREGRTQALKENIVSMRGNNGTTMKDIIVKLWQDKTGYNPSTE